MGSVVVSTWDGNSINDGTNYRAALVNRPGFPPVQSRSIGRSQALSVPGQLTYGDLSIELQIFVEDTENLSAKVKDLSVMFDPRDNVSKKLVITDPDGSNPRYIKARAINMITIPGTGRVGFRVPLMVDGLGDVDGRFRRETADTDTWAVTASGQTNTVSVSGEDDAYPVIEITPTAAKSVGFQYKRFIALNWRAAIGQESYPVDITKDSLDTATLISGGKMQADGDDLRVYRDGAEIDRWLDGINTSTTKVWVNLDFAPAGAGTLAASLAASGALSSIDLNEDISNFPESGILLIDSEIFVYTAKNDELKRFTGISRAQKGTSEAAHSAAADVSWLQHDLWIYYGDSSLSAPDTDNDYKPIMDLSTSTNTSWDYNEFLNDSGTRTGAWARSLDDENAEYYGGDEYTTADPFEELGIYCELATGAYTVTNQCGISNINFANGQKKSGLSTSTFLGLVRSGKEGVGFTNEYTIPAPTTSGSWQAWSYSAATTTIGDKGQVPTYVRLSLADSLQGWVECADVTLTLNASKTPSITVGAEQTNYPLELTLTNNTTGKYITISFNMEVDETLIIDTDQKTITYEKDGSSQFQALTGLGGENRRDWLPLEVGNNELQYDDTGTDTVTVDLSWQRRYYD